MESKPKLEVVTTRQSLTEDQQTEILDRALTAAETELLPLLVVKSATDTFSMFLAHLHTHGREELSYIKVGKPPIGEPGTALHRLRDRCVELKNGTAKDVNTSRNRWKL